jgi:hypothetical protein
MKIFLIDFFYFFGKKVDLHMAHGDKYNVDKKYEPDAFRIILYTLLRFDGDALKK